MKTFYHKTTRNPAVFADDANIADWPEYQETMPAPTAEEVRAERDELLRETDWWAVVDRTMTQEQIDYRQALRDVPQQSGFPETVVFPTKPEETN
ncbi:MAG: phage tail assembly chaperone [Candidatus Thiodiazotropha taylori]|uniref:Phage tail assembly chaperone n=1 Tax=Candidatus Thiodiazotropha taylori TaxID=2792791 RepID=A0A9E4K9E3_9GAMM|nr:phage tail assembly chaperone [Candidatus Thiodiazotropha taylori]MCW4255014.1 phage tail assembly chaperone [Candidatus Thiodiazotropha taylori]